MSPNTTWKSVERRLASRLGGVRIGQYGGADVETEVAVLEVKTRKKLPEWLVDAVNQAHAHCPGPEKMHAVVLHELSGRTDKDLVVMRFSEFEAWHGKVAEVRKPHPEPKVSGQPGEGLLGNGLPELIT